MATTTLLETAPLPPIYRHGNSDILPAWSQREAAAAEQPWTVTRCHRQLRPLLTHLMALRREKARAALKQRNDSLRQPQSPHKRSIPEDDLASRKRVRYTYSLKGTGRRRQGRSGAAGSTSFQTEEEQNKGTKVVPLKPKAQRSFCPGEVVVATPVLSRARKHRQAWSLPSSPIMRCTTASTSETGRSSLPLAESETPRPKPRNPSFKYRGYYQSSLQLGASSNNTKSSIDGYWATLIKATPPEFRQLYESIFRAVDALLRATTCVLGPTRKSNSLLAMCLRKVPHYVAICEEAEREDAEKEGTVRLPSSSVSLGIYGDLESLGSENGGWKHLRTVVRAHGISILKAACAEGLLHDTFIRLLIRLCTHMKAYDEAEGLMTALFDSHISSVPKGQYLYRKPDEAKGDLSESTGPIASLGMLLQYADETGRTSIPLRQVTDLLNSGHLPSAWLSTQVFGSLWHRTVRLLSSRGSPVCDENILLDFTAAAVTQLIHSRPDDDILNLHHGADHRNTSDPSNTIISSLTSSSSYHTLVSILGSICAVSILQQEVALESSDSGAAHEPAVLKRLSVIIQHSLSETSQRIKRKKGQNKLDAAAHCFPRQYLLMLALCLLHTESTKDACNRSDKHIELRESSTFGETAFQQMIKKADSAQKGQVYDATIAFVTSVAENCGRGSASAVSNVPAARAYLLELCAHAASHLSNALDYDSKDNLAIRLQADAAFLLASRSNDLRDLAFAEILGKSSIQMNERRPLFPGPRARHSPTSTSTGALTSPPSKTHPASMTVLFEGYRWEEGISEWVVPTPSSSSCPERNPKPGRKNEMVVIIDDFFPPELATQDKKNPFRRLSSKYERLSLPASFPASSPSSGDDSDVDARSVSNGESSDSTPPPITPNSKTAESPRTSRKRSRRLRSIHSIWPSKARLRTTQSLLNLVSDNEDDDDENDEYDEYDEYDEIGDEFYGGETATSATHFPLFDRASNTKRPVGSGNAQQKQEMAVCSVSYRITDDDIDATTSDDELCL